MEDSEIIYKILGFLKKQHFSGKMMQYLDVEEVIREAGLENTDKNQVLGNISYLAGKKFINGNRRIGVSHPVSIYINNDGIDHFNKMEENEKSGSKNGQSVSDNKIIAGRDVNIVNAGNDNRIETNGSNSKNKTHSKMKIILLIVGTIATLILVGYVIYDHSKLPETITSQPPIVNNSSISINNSPININNGVTTQPKGTAIMQFKDITNDGKIFLPIDFEVPHKEDYYTDKIQVLGAVPNDGIINVKLLQVNFKQYNESLFTLYTPYLVQDIQPRPVNAGKLNETFTFEMIANYGTSPEYHNRNDTTWYEVKTGDATFQFNYSGVQNNFQSFNFTQPLSIKVKSIPPENQLSSYRPPPPHQESISVYIDKTSYNNGHTVIVRGVVNSIIQDQLVTIQVRNKLGEPIDTRFIAPDLNGRYTMHIPLSYQLSDGTYSVIVNYGSAQNQTIFNYLGS